MYTKDIEYLLERAISERELAKVAKHPKAVAAHEELAQRYDALLKAQTRPILHAETTGHISQAANAA